MLNIAMVVGLIKALAPVADPSVIEQAVDDYLEAHPEITVADGSITEEKLAVDVALTLSTLESDVSDVKNAIHGLFDEKPLKNYYEPQDIADILDGYILKRGVPQTQYGSGYYVSDYVPVVGGKSIKFSFTPWTGADDIYRCASYDTNKTYIETIKTDEVTLPANAAYIRFSVRKSLYGGTAATALAYVNANMIISDGSTVEYDAIDEEKNKYQSASLVRRKDTYFIDTSQSDILILSKMKGKNDKDVGLKLRSFSSNSSLQFCSFGTVDNNSPFVSNEPNNYVEYMSTGEDFFGPIIAYVENNIDGDDPNTGYFTGGMHKFNSYNTARRTALDIYIDGRAISGFVGYCDTIDIIAKYNVQVSNTLKNDGTGREAVEQITALHFENGVIYVTTSFKALEPVNISTFYFMQGNHKANGMGSGGIRYVGSRANRGIYSMDETSNSGDKYSRIMRMLSNVLQMDIEMDDYDIGEMAYADSQVYSAFVRTYTGYTKCYFNAIGSSTNMLHLNTGDMCMARGSIKLGLFE